MIYPALPTIGHNPWLTKAMPTRNSLIAGVTIHATRSGSPGAEYDDGPGTDAWGRHPANKHPSGNWGTYWDRLVYRSGIRRLSTRVDREYATWTAGYGAYGPPVEWPLGLYYVQMEISQARPDQPYSWVSIDSAAEETAILAHNYDFPLVRISYVDQIQWPPPRGITTHEGSANGRKLGKTDPGPLFPWDLYLNRARYHLTQLEADMTPSEVRAIVLEVLREQQLVAADLPTYRRFVYAITKRIGAIHEATDLDVVPGEGGNQ